MMVDLAWNLMLMRMQNDGALPAHIDSVRAAFCAGVYAASADVTLHRSTGEQISLVADRIERQ